MTRNYRPEAVWPSAILEPLRPARSSRLQAVKPILTPKGPAYLCSPMAPARALDRVMHVPRKCTPQTPRKSSGNLRQITLRACDRFAASAVLRGDFTSTLQKAV